MDELKDKEVISLKHIIVYYLHHWKVFAVTFVISLIPAILYLMLYPKTYEIVSDIQIQDDKNLLSSGSMGLGEAAGIMKSFGLGGGSGSGVNIDDELSVLQSNDLLNRTVLDLGLNVEYYKPYAWHYQLYETSPLLVLATPATFANVNEDITLNVVVRDTNVKITVEVAKKKKEFKFTSLPATLVLEQGTFNIHYAEGFESPTSDIDMEVIIRPSRWVAEEISDKLVVEENSKTSNIIELGWRDYEKKRGVDLLTTLIANYNNRADLIKQEEGEKALLFLNNRIDSVIMDLGDIEQKISIYKIKNKLTDLEYDIQFYSEQMKELQSKIIEVEAQSHVIEMMDAYVKNPANQYNVVPTLLSAQEGEKGSALTLYNEALIERARLLQNSSENNPLIEAMEDRIKQLRSGVFLTISNAKKGLLLTLDDLKNKEKVIYEKMASVPDQERQYIDYKRQQEILQGVYLILLQKREEVALSTHGLVKSKALVVDSAYIKKLPVGPRKLFAVIGVFIFTLIIPIGYLYGKEQLMDLIKAYKASKS
ncbi:tyrosine protein kinase [Parabacteroides gordonii]|uniref:tyrosine protein kinase n=1 Tax=Parabacteroides gordonii TaxID=574930 RepID=UPI0026EF8CAE|nr:tyrosine protein kinase [Parabacteroides gordonii]